MKRFFSLILALLFSVVVNASIRAQSTEPYELVNSNVGPGGFYVAGDYELGASAGQPDADEASGGDYTLGGGFWGGGAVGRSRPRRSGDMSICLW
jgi:hypothetical protein